MSFTTYGGGRRSWQEPLAGYQAFGDVAIANADGSPFSIGATSAGATVLATKIALDPSISGALNSVTQLPVISPISSINLSYLGATFSHTVESSFESIANEIISALPDSLWNTLSDVVSAVSNGIPIVGAVFSMIAQTISAISGEAAANKNWEDQQCKMFLDAYVADKTGGLLDLCQTCPCDLFFPSVVDATNYANCTYSNHPTARAYATACANGIEGAESGAVGLPDAATRAVGRFGPNGEEIYAYRPALGMALMRATEGSFFDPYEVAPAYRNDFLNYELTSYEKLREGFGIQLTRQGRIQESVWWFQRGGMSYERRMQFRTLRRAIQGASKKYGVLADGGMSLWPVYQDLLLDSFTNGSINLEFVSYLLRYQYLSGPDSNHLAPENVIGNRYWFGSGSFALTDTSTCADALAAQIAGIVDNWQNSVQSPGTALGGAKLAGLRQQAVTIAERIARGPLKFQTTGSMHPGYVLHPQARTTPASKFHPSAAVFGAGAAAAVIFFFL